MITPTGTRWLRPSSPTITTISTAAIRAVLDPVEPALEEHLTVDRLAHHQLGPPAREPAVVVHMT